MKEVGGGDPRPCYRIPPSSAATGMSSVRSTPGPQTTPITPGRRQHRKLAQLLGLSAFASRGVQLMIAASLLPVIQVQRRPLPFVLSRRAAVTFKLYKARNHHLCLSLGSHRITIRHLLTLRTDLVSLPSEIITFHSTCISS